MSKLQIVDAKTMERLLLLLGFERVRQKGSHVFFTGTQMGGPLLFHIIKEEF